MSFKDIYAKVNEVKDLSVGGILDKLNIEFFFLEDIPLGKKAMIIGKTIAINQNLSDEELDIVLLHEIGHYCFDRGGHCCNHRTEENNANIFMCLYLVHNEIWDSQYFDEFLIYKGVDHKAAWKFNEFVWQYKRQEILKLAY